MEFHEAADFLFDLRRFAPRPGLDPTRELLGHLGDPHERLDCVQVAGSNGKGSTARMVERALRETGLSVGLYTSPHLDDVRERVRVDGRPMTESAVTEFVESFREYATERATDGDSPTFFEALTAMALWEFDRQDVDVAVLEVGIGGTLDATSVVDPIASAVTAVTLEHTDLLGDTVAEIARDKSGVAPADAPLVTATTGDALGAIREEVDDVVTVADADWNDPEDPDIVVEYGGREGLEGAVTVEGVAENWTVDTHLPLLGAHQARNAGVAAALVRQVAARLDADAATEPVERGFRNAHWPGRFEVMDREPLVVLDGAHNPGGCETTADVLDTFDYDEAHLVVGAMTDKDHRGIAAAFADAGLGRVVACRPDHDRAESAEVVARAFETETDADVTTHEPVAGALDRALDAAGPDDAVVVSGSLYAVAEARTRWSRPTVPLDVDSVADAEGALRRAHVAGDDASAAAGDAVHRVLRTRLRPRRARRLQSELRALGGEVALSALADQDQERVDAVAMGTRTQFERLADALADREDDLAPLAGEIRSGIDASPSPNAATPTPDADRSAADRDYPWADGTAVMGILNITPDSFHDGGEYNSVADARQRAERMVEAGVEILDIGGESTRPGGEVVPAEEEIDRVVPVIEAIADIDAMISIDTRKASVARAAIDAGADLLNDVSGLEDPEMRLVAADHDVPVVVMHSIEAPVDPTTEVEYDDVVDDVVDYLAERVLLAEKAGLDRSQILVDPGLGFGKSAAESFELLGRLDELAALGCPILVGHSRKSMFELTEGGREGALDETVAGTALAAERGADVIRVHDAHENVAAVRVAQAAADPDRFDGE
ncbi:dihydropteroate synthase [Halosimplex carlsbadense 2-9-1]|uniref:Probable bifunctional folylpolyglutamate synthase/dihydropteroate synthase n=1 Tax=Halosimplex carlsbadense 2-9-1 TaxID=797114 RepID=M0CHL9_9EURY|nr:dihydropteroate synthase [Halosimplex carlsbadense]ELZ22795.1 dihydropteroate synthase [Halosimplex carlsbadense 2-9-1]